MLLVGMAQVLVSELVTIDAFSTSSIAASEITTLCHESCDDSVEGASFVVERLSLSSLAFLSSAEGSEVLSSIWVSISTQFHGDSASCLATDGDVEVNLWIGHYFYL